MSSRTCPRCDGAGLVSKDNRSLWYCCRAGCGWESRDEPFTRVEQLEIELEAVRATLERWKFGPPESDWLPDEIDRAMAHMSTQKLAIELLQKETLALRTVVAAQNSLTATLTMELAEAFKKTNSAASPANLPASSKTHVDGRAAVDSKGGRR